MPIRFETLDDLLVHGFDDVIDVRSPAEFAEDHIPCAINLPALDNAERAEVGRVYKQVSPFDARKLGGAMVIRNVARHLEGPLAGKSGSWRPLVYCWRGGQRSGVFRTILSEVGWRSETISGGYQSFRRLVHANLYQSPLAHNLVLLDGNTGTAKTEILARLSARGHQVLDLEALACHRGSLLGDRPEGQPAQKSFETQIACALSRFSAQSPVLVEAESSKIGRRILPKSLWHAMLGAPRIVIEAPEAARAAYLAKAYEDVISDPEILAERLAPLRQLRGHSIVDGWVALSRQGALFDLSLALMQQHYDPSYAKSRRIDQREVLATLQADGLVGADQERIVDQIAKLLAKG